MSEVKKLNELGSGRVATNLGLDASGKLIKESVVKENYGEAHLGAGANRWVRIAKLTESYPGGIIFLSSGIWSGNPRMVTFAINSCYDGTAKKESVLVKVLAGQSSQISAARIVKEGTERYLEFRIYTSKVMAKSIGYGIETVSATKESSPAADAEITDIEIERETTTTT